MITFTKIIYKSLLVAVCSLPLYSQPLDETIQEGEELFKEANCQKCHIVDGEFDKMNKKVQNVNNLASWVSTCDNSLHIGWFPEEQEKVTKYLNETYYKLKK